MNGHPIDAVREARRKISAEHGHDPHRPVEHYKELQQRHKDRLISPDSEPSETEESVDSAGPAATRD